MPRQTEAEELIRLMRELGQLSEHEDTKLTTRGGSALLTHLALGHNGATAGELRQALEVGSSRVANALKHLEAQGLIHRAASEEDGRVVQVFLTQKGRDFITKRYQRLLHRVNLVLDELGEEDSAEYLRLTRKLIQAMAKVAGHAEPA